MMIAERHDVGDLPAGGGGIRFETIRPGDSGDEIHPRSAGDDDRIARGRNHPRCGDRLGHAENGLDFERAGDPLRRSVVGSGDERGVGNGGRRQPFAQPARRQRLIGEIVFGDENQIDGPRELDVLKSIVENVDRRSQLAFGEASRQVAVRADED